MLLLLTRKNIVQLSRNGEVIAQLCSFFFFVGRELSKLEGGGGGGGIGGSRIFGWVVYMNINEGRGTVNYTSALTAHTCIQPLLSNISWIHKQTI